MTFTINDTHHKWHLLSVIMQSAFMVSVTFSYCYAECRYAVCRSAECHYAECHYAECRCAECRGALIID